MSFYFGATLSPLVCPASSSFAMASDVAAGAASVGAAVVAGAASSAGAALSLFPHAVMNIDARSIATAIVMDFIVSLFLYVTGSNPIFASNWANLGSLRRASSSGSLRA